MIAYYRLILATLGLAATLAPAAEVTFRSGPARVTLLELYTSEGCSSCPPAEKRFGELRSDPNLWRGFVPVAFHVNYWDHLGWRDALASKVFTQRQHAYAATWRASTVYTPGFVRDGAEWRPSGASLVTPAGGTASAGSANEAGELTLTWEAEGICRVHYVPPAGRASRGALGSKGENQGDALEISVALLGGGIVSNVRAGENSGRELRHEFVALALAGTPLHRAADGSYAATVALALPLDRKLPAVARRALAARVTPQGQLAPLQATGGWLPAPPPQTGL